MIEAVSATSTGRGIATQQQAKKQALLQALRNGHTRTDAAGLAGIHKDTLYEWLKRDPSFSDEVLRAELSAVDYHLGCWRDGAKDDWRASMEYLARRRPDDYARKETQQVYLQVGRELAQLSDEQLLALATGGVVPNGSGEVIDVEATVEGASMTNDASE